MRVDDETIFEEDGYESNAYDTIGGNRYRALNIKHELNGVEHMALRDAVNDCGNSCNVTIHITDMGRGYQQYSTNYAGPPWNYNYFKVAVETRVVDEFTSDWLMVASSWTLALLNMLVALASTKYWAPSRMWFSSL